MDLSTILLSFRAAAEVWATSLVDLLEPTFLFFRNCGFILIFLGIIFDYVRGVAAIFYGMLWLGLTHVLFLYGWGWAYDLSHGVRQVAYHLGAPSFDPTAIVQLGLYVASPLLEAVSNQGILGTLWHPSTVIFSLAGVLALLAFCVLAFVQFSFILLNYLLIGGAPFFLLWFPIPGLNALTQVWVSAMIGNLAGLFVCGLVAGVMRDVVRAMGENYQAIFAEAVGTRTLVWSDFGEPLATMIVLAFAFAWIPWQFSRAAWSVGNSLWGGASALASAGLYAATMPASKSTGGGVSKGGSDSGKDGGWQRSQSTNQGQIASSQQTMTSQWGSGQKEQQGATSAPHKSDWNGR